MNNNRQSSSSGGTVNTDSQREKTNPGTAMAFWLVVIMLSTLFILILSLLFVVTWFSANNAALEFSKWTLSVLLGAFGAWIGAGAAYFFGKENLAESSRSTEEALKIQQTGLQGVTKLELIRELPLTVMNKEFMFKPDSTKQAVLEGLDKHVDYWWVPVLDKDGNGTLVDIIHARVFWDDDIPETDVISTIITNIDTMPELKKKYGALHSASFFVKVALEDKIADVADNMNKSGVAVGVIVDERGRPSYCFTRQNLLTAQM